MCDVSICAYVSVSINCVCFRVSRYVSLCMCVCVGVYICVCVLIVYEYVAMCVCVCVCVFVCLSGRVLKGSLKSNMMVFELSVMIQRELIIFGLYG